MSERASGFQEVHNVGMIKKKTGMQDRELRARRSDAGDTVIFRDPLRLKEGEGGGKNSVYQDVSP